MSFLNSLFCGKSGDYSVCGVDVHFTASDEKPSKVFGEGCFSSAVKYFLGNSVCRIFSLGYLHIFIHEMGHALAAKCCKKPGELLAGINNSDIYIYTNTCEGNALTLPKAVLSKIERIWILIAGPLAGILLEIIKIISAVALAVLLPSFVGIPLAICLGAGSLIWLFGELMYIVADQGDWAELREVLKQKNEAIPQTLTTTIFANQ